MGSYIKKESSDHPGWYTVPGYPYFLANKEGKVKNAKTGYETFGSKDDRGYLRVCMWDNDKKSKKDLKAHVIVCTAFHGPCPKGMEVGHKDDNRSNNKPSNLHWTTRKSNMKKVFKQESLTMPSYLDW